MKPILPWPDAPPLEMTAHSKSPGWSFRDLRWWQIVAGLIALVLFFAWVASRLDWLFE